MSNRDEMTTDALRRGLALRRQVLGDDYVDDTLSTAGEIDSDFQRYITEHCWGVVWSDERLTLRERSIATLAATAALGRMDVFRIHIRGAINNGLTTDELRALVLHIAVYAGAPAALAAQSALREALTGGVGEADPAT